MSDTHPFADVTAPDALARQRALWDGHARLIDWQTPFTEVLEYSPGAKLPPRVHFVTGLPKTRSGKVLRRAIQATCERRDPGDLTTIDDPGPLEQVKQAHLGAV